jgi:hypothetical protein
MVWQASPEAQSSTYNVNSIHRTGSGATGEVSETASRASRSSLGSKQSAISEATQKINNNGPSPRSTLMPPQARDRVKAGASGGAAEVTGASPPPTTAAPRNLFGRKVEHKEDKKIAAYIVKLKDELKRLQDANGGNTPTKADANINTDRLTDILTKIRMLLDVRVEKGDKTALPADMNLGANIVEVMRHYPANHSLLMEECTCILYFVSVLDPSFKKGVARLFKAMADHKSNVAIQRAACEGIRNVVQANPDALPRIAPSLGVILQSMAAHGNNAKLIFKSLELLADLALEPVSKPLFVQKGGVGLLHVLSAMNRHSADASIQAAGCRSVANLSLGATREVLQRLTPSLDVLLRAMNRHTAHAHVQLYGCMALGNLATWHHAEIVHQGGVDAILPSMRESMADSRLQQEGCATLAKVIDSAKDAETRATYVDAICSQEGIQTILQSLTQHAGTETVQVQGLSVLLGCVSNSVDHHEIFLSEGGLDVMIRAMTTFDDKVDVASRGMELLKNFTRQSLDFQRAVFAKGGIGVVIGLMKEHHQAHSVQDPAFACLRNIAIHPENRMTIVEQDGIPTMVNNMQIYVGDAAIQAYGCDALGRLAQGSGADETAEMVMANGGLETALRAMECHPNHPGVQDRSIFLLLSLTSERPEAIATLKQLPDAIETIKQARIPQKEAAMERCQTLIKSLEARSWFLGRK